MLLIHTVWMRLREKDKDKSKAGDAETEAGGYPVRIRMVSEVLKTKKRRYLQNQARYVRYSGSECRQTQSDRVFSFPGYTVSGRRAEGQMNIKT